MCLKDSHLQSSHVTSRTTSDGSVLLEVTVELSTATLDHQVLRLEVHSVERRKPVAAESLDPTHGNSTCVAQPAQSTTRIPYPLLKVLSLMFDTVASIYHHSNLLNGFLVKDVRVMSNIKKRL